MNGWLCLIVSHCTLPSPSVTTSSCNLILHLRQHTLLYVKKSAPSRSLSQSRRVRTSALIPFLSALSLCFRTRGQCPLHPCSARSHCSCWRSKRAAGSAACGKLSCSTTMWLSRSSPFRYVKGFQSH